MFEPLIKAVLAGAKEQVVTVQGEDFYVEGGKLIRPPSRLRYETTCLATLDGLIKYINADPSHLFEFEDLRARVIVQSPTEVNFTIQWVPEDDYHDLACSADIYAGESMGIQCRNSFEPEDFIIFLKTKFADNPDRQEIIDLASDVKVKSETDITEEGGVQTVTTTNKVHLKTNTSIKSEYRLLPFRTFAEIEQPEMPCTVRCKRDGNENAKFSLIVFDDPRWRNTAIKSIAAYIEAKLERDIPVLA